MITAGAVLLISNDDRQPSRASQSTVKDELRTLLVYEKSENPTPSASGELMHARVVKGELPSRASVAVVKTDEDCAPDRAGISHCLNRLRMKDGSFIKVRHPHDMHKVPCMTPGERVEVKPA